MVTPDHPVQCLHITAVWQFASVIVSPQDMPEQDEAHKSLSAVMLVQDKQLLRPVLVENWTSDVGMCFCPALGQQDCFGNPRCP